MMEYENRIHQLEQIANRDLRHEGKYEQLAKGERELRPRKVNSTISCQPL